MNILKNLQEKSLLKPHEIIDAKHQLGELAPEIVDLSKNKVLKKAKAKRGLKPGVEVLVLSYNQRGNLIRLAKDGRWEVQMGLITTKLSEDEFEPIEPEETVKKIVEIAEAIGKTPVQVNEAAGFVVNRILIPMINEAAFIKMEGVSDIAGIDAAMKLGANHPMGPLELGDFVGLDICLAIMDVLYAETGDSKYRACPLLRKMVRGGNLGVKSGMGFYKYNEDRTKTPVDAL